MPMPLMIAASLSFALGGPPPPWTDYRDAAGIDAAISNVVAQHPGRAEVNTYGASRTGRPLRILTLGTDGEGARPAFLIVAGLDPRHRAGCEYAVAIADTILRDHADLLEEVAFHIVPVANPDGLHALDLFNDGRRGVDRDVDADRDGLLDEDAPVDVDGDGRILTIRTTTPRRGVEPTHVVDSRDPRLMRLPVEERREQPTHAIFVEGFDADGDGRIAEDGPGDLRLDHNYMHLYRPNLPTAGPHQLSEPESLALAEFVIARPEIFGAMVFGPHDTVLETPDHKTLDVTGKVPVGIAAKDLPIYRELGDTYRDLVGDTLTVDETDHGAFHAWLYAQRGIPTAAVTGWGPPATPMNDKEATDPEDASPEMRWLRFLDETSRDHAMATWRPFEHPTLGVVEIGGEIPGARLTPPADQIPTIAAKHAAFAAAMAANRPEIACDLIAVERLTDGLLRLDLRIRNDGPHPLRTEMARRNRAIGPMVVAPQVDRDRIIVGPPILQIETLEPNGGLTDASWVLRDDGEPFDVVIDDPRFGRHVVTVTSPSAEGGAS